ncbi:hypothetical protein ILUMI_14375, partial [Ignelater luminosus]
MQISDDQIGGALFSHIITKKLDNESKEKFEMSQPNKIPSTDRIGCEHCNKFHNTLLHETEKDELRATKDDLTPKDELHVESILVCNYNQNRALTLLSTAKVAVKTAYNETYYVRVLLDSAIRSYSSGDLPAQVLRNSSVISSAMTHCCISEHVLNDNIQRLWELENVKPENPSSLLSQEERECENHFSETVTRNKDGRIIVKIPWNNNVQNL